jgi:hypothetical protein
VDKQWRDVKVGGVATLGPQSRPQTDGRVTPRLGLRVKQPGLRWTLAGVCAPRSDPVLDPSGQGTTRPGHAEPTRRREPFAVVDSVPVPSRVPPPRSAPRCCDALHHNWPPQGATHPHRLALASLRHSRHAGFNCRSASMARLSPVASRRSSRSPHSPWIRAAVVLGSAPDCAPCGRDRLSMPAVMRVPPNVRKPQPAAAPRARVSTTGLCVAREPAADQRHTVRGAGPARWL